MSHAAIDDVAYPKLLSDVLWIGGFAFVAETRAARDHAQPADARQSGNQVGRDPIRKILLRNVAAKVSEWENCDAGLASLRLWTDRSARRLACTARWCRPRLGGAALLYRSDKPEA